MRGAFSRGNAFTPFLGLPILLFTLLLTGSLVENTTEFVDNVTGTFMEIGEFLDITGNETTAEEINASEFIDVDEYLNNTDTEQIQRVQVINVTMGVFQEDYEVEYRGDYFITLVSEGHRSDIERGAFARLSDNETARLLVEDDGEYSVVEIDKRELGKLIKDGADRIYIDAPVSAIYPEEYEEIGILENITACILDTGVGEEDANGHGTLVASYLKGEIISVKVLDDNGIGYSSDVIEGIEECIDGNADVILMYFGYGRFDSDCDDEAIVRAADKAIENGITVISPEEYSAPGCGSMIINKIK
ncbi:hypothetical protein GF374_03340, partial [Candidatus Woesearchaeota archaeon]|nr:hypothetical protein [Candidatus Woesearchaeota archaeon]